MITRSIEFTALPVESLAIMLGGAHPVAQPGEVSVSFQHTVPSSPPPYYPARGWRRWIPGAHRRAMADQQRRHAVWLAAGCPPVLITTFIPRATIAMGDPIEVGAVDPGEQENHR